MKINVTFPADNYTLRKRGNTFARSGVEYALMWNDWCVCEWEKEPKEEEIREAIALIQRVVHILRSDMQLGVSSNLKFEGPLFTYEDRSNDNSD